VKKSGILPRNWHGSCYWDFFGGFLGWRGGILFSGCNLIQDLLEKAGGGSGIAADDRIPLVNPERAAVRKGAQKQFAAFWYDSKTNTLEAATKSRGTYLIPASRMSPR
jgi:hypothetical protein